MNVLMRIWKSSLGKKYIMAISGAVLVLFVIGHMLGNLQLFLGPEALNRYAHFLQSNVELLWPVRMVLLLMVALHIASATTLTLENQAARPVDYSNGQPPFAAPLSSRMMFVGGLVVAFFVIYHLLHYTVNLASVNFTGVDFAHLTDPKTGYHDVYAMVVRGFSPDVWYVGLFYAVGVGLLCYHLSHGISAMFQSLGLKNRVYGPFIDKAAKVIAIALFAGYLAVPTGVLLGYGKDYVQNLKTTTPATHSVAVLK